MPHQAESLGSLLGHELSHYRIIEEIGSGGMGAVYRAHDQHLDREVAIKLLNPGTITDEAARKHLRKEALALSKLNHPNIAIIYDFDRKRGVDFLVMEHIPGIKLNEKLAAGPLSQREVIRLGTQLSDGLAAAHEHGVVHRDLKPGNLRLTSDGRLKILDFGLAKLRQPVAETDATESSLQTHSISGTLPYMAPEQLAGEEVDARTDIHGAGFVLYEMATGQRPFAEVQSGQLIGALMRKPPIPPTTLNPRVSAELERIIGKCMEKDPENRYQSAKELAIDLRRLGGAGTTPTPVQKRERRTPNLILVAGAMSVAVCVALFALNVGGWRDRLLGKTVAPPIRSLAVLPLANLSQDPGQEYFADGMTEELITNLSTISGLRVISRTSTMQYKGSNKPLPKIAQELNVEAVMEGSVRRVGDRVRITLQLLEAAPERHLWASSYDRDLKDILTLQSDVAQTVAREVKLSATTSVNGHVSTARIVNPEAYEACLKGRYFLKKWAPDGLKKAFAHFQHSIDIDPTFASAYAGLADAYIWSAMAGAQPPNEAFSRARAAAQKALELDEQLADAHVSLAAVMFQFDWNWAGAEQEYRQAINLNPNSSAHFGYGFYLATMGRPDEAINETKRALDLDPLTPITNLQLGWVLYYARRHDESTAQLKKTLDLAPDLAYAHMELGWNYAQKRMYREAVTECQRAVRLSPEDQVVLGSCGRVYAIAGERAEALKCLASIKGLSARGYIDPYNVAALYDGLGENDRTLEWFERAYRERSASLVGLRVEILSDSLRSEPRFHELIDRMKFPQ